MFSSEKKSIRKEIKSLLNNNQNCFAKWSDIICKKILHSELYKNSTIILAYMALQDEADIQPVISKGFLEGKKVYIPRIISGTNKMDFYRFNPDSCKEGSFGILEPETHNEIFDLNSLSNQNVLMLIPGRAFTKDGKRLGRGKGFYDLFLTELLNKKGDSANCQITLCGICFDCQLLPDLPTEAHDIKMDLIISEE